MDLRRLLVACVALPEAHREICGRLDVEETFLVCDHRHDLGLGVTPETDQRRARQPQAMQASTRNSHQRS